MSIDLVKYKDHYLCLHADCIPVRGAVRSVICDLTRNELIFFPDSYYDVLDYLMSDKIDIVMAGLEQDDEKNIAEEFVAYLFEHELGWFVKDRSMFPCIEEQWDTPAIIQNAIIDVDEVHHDFRKIFKELDKLGCKTLQLRSFSNLLSVEDIHQLLNHALHTSVESIEILLKHDASVSDDTYIQLVTEQPVISSLILHSASEERKIVANFGFEQADDYTCKYIRLTTQCITSQHHCGVISIKTMNAPTVDNFFEHKLHNGCLNRKISIDKEGEIKNCPSMIESFGNVKNIKLSSVVNQRSFQEKWNIHKDQVDTCRDCEFRYVCSDCRAYVEDPSDQYSKPLKCGYNPYTCEWEDWADNPLKQKAMHYYKVPEQAGMATTIAD